MPVAAQQDGQPWSSFTGSSRRFGSTVAHYRNHRRSLFRGVQSRVRDACITRNCHLADTCFRIKSPGQGPPYPSPRPRRRTCASPGSLAGALPLRQATAEWSGGYAVPIRRIAKETPMSKQMHEKAAEHHEQAAKAHRAAAQQHGSNDHASAKQQSAQALEKSKAAHEQSTQAHNTSQQQR